MTDESKTKEQLVQEIECLRKQMEEELKTTKQQIEFILGHTKTGLDIIDSKFNIRYINTEWQKVYGNPKGKKCYEYFMGRKEVCPTCSVKKVFETKRPLVTEEVLVKENNRSIQVTTIPFQDHNGEWLVAEVNVDITERKRLENILRESEERFKIIFNESTDGMLLAEIETKRFVMCNPRICKMLGYSEEELLRMVVENIHSEKDLPFVMEQFQQQVKKELELATLPVKRKDGSIFYADVNTSQITLAGEKYLLGSFRDITERKQAEEALRISGKKIRAIFDQTFQFIGMMTLDGTLIEANRTAMQFAGINESDCLGKPFWDTPWWTHSKELQNKLREAVKRAASGETVRFEATHLAADRSLHDIDFSLKPIKDEDGKIVFLIPEGRDITEHRKVEEQLKKYQEHLEELVEKRTHELEMVNKKIRQDVVMCNSISEELQKSEKRYRELWDDAPVAYHTLDKNGSITNVNRTETKMLGYKPQEMIGKSIFDFILPEQQETAKKRFEEKLSGKYVLKTEGRVYITKNGSKLNVSIDDMLEYDHEGKITGIKTTMVDVTENKKMEEALRESELQYKTTINSMRDSIYVVDADLRIILYNESLRKWLESVGLKAELSGKILFDVIPFLSDKARNEYRQVFESKETLTTEEHINLMGKEWVTEVRKIPIEENNEIIRVLTIIRDITERRKTEETIKHLAYHDILTNLPNRTLFNNRLALELNRAQRNKQKVSVMLMDLDRFKKINDTMGHSLGDQLLQGVGKRLLEIVRSSDTVARMGGDEFILLLPETSKAKDIAKIAKKILEVIKKPFFISGKELEVTTSIGISVYPTHGEDAETLIKNADIAMYQAKKAGRDNFVRYKANPK